MTVHRRSVTVGELDLHYLEAGSGPPVLMLHGWPTRAELYRNILPIVGQHRRAIALDLPGFGRSSKPLDASYSFRFYDRVLDGFLEALGIDRTGLVVHDLGGPLGLHWAVARQERITDLVLLNTLVFPEMSWAVKLFGAATFTPGIRALLTSAWGLERSMKFGVADSARITPEVAAIYQEPFADQDAQRVLLKTVHGLHPKGFAAIEEGLGGFDVPVCLLYGDQDRILPDVARTMARVKERLPHAELDSLAGCGHFLQEDRPEEVGEHLARFLATSVADPSGQG